MDSRTELSVGSLPGRKQKALSLTTFHAEGGASLKPLAYFVDDEAFEDFKKALGGFREAMLSEETARRAAYPDPALYDGTAWPVVEWEHARAIIHEALDSIDPEKKA